MSHKKRVSSGVWSAAPGFADHVARGVRFAGKDLKVSCRIIFCCWIWGSARWCRFCAVSSSVSRRIHSALRGASIICCILLPKATVSTAAAVRIIPLVRGRCLSSGRMRWPFTMPMHRIPGTTFGSVFTFTSRWSRRSARCSSKMCSRYRTRAIFFRILRPAVSCMPRGSFLCAARCTSCFPACWSPVVSSRLIWVITSCAQKIMWKQTMSAIWACRESQIIWDSAVAISVPFSSRAKAFRRRNLLWICGCARQASWSQSGDIAPEKRLPPAGIPMCSTFLKCSSANSECRRDDIGASINCNARIFNCFGVFSILFCGFGRYNETRKTNFQEELKRYDSEKWISAAAVCSGKLAEPEWYMGLRLWFRRFRQRSKNVWKRGVPTADHRAVLPGKSAFRHRIQGFYERSMVSETRFAAPGCGACAAAFWRSGLWEPRLGQRNGGGWTSRRLFLLCVWYHGRRTGRRERDRGLCAGQCAFRVTAGRKAKREICFVRLRLHTHDRYLADGLAGVCTADLPETLPRDRRRPDRAGNCHNGGGRPRRR